MLLTLCTTVLFAQDKSYTVTGNVVDEQQQPLIGVVVLEKGTSNGAVTGVEGEYTFNVVSAESVIELTYLGYTTKEIPASQANGTVVLQEDAMKLDDVVVIGYGTVKKDDMTGSVVAVQAEDINRGAVTSPQQLMQGKVPGLSILPGDGAPGSGSTIRIRGAASLNASNDPLIVIDGVPVSNSGVDGMPNMLSTINPNDIASFTVLKDASATAIYGSRASNGVIIITTKKGTRGKVNVSYNSSYGIATNTKTIDVLSTQEYQDYILGAFPAESTNGQAIRNMIGDSSTDWQDLIYQNAFITDQNVSINGTAGEWLPYRASVGYTNEEGTIKTSKTERTTINVALSPTLLDEHLKINVNAKAYFGDNTFANGGAVNSAAFFDPTQSQHMEDKSNGWFNWYTSDGKPATLAPENPMSLLYDNYSYSDSRRITANAQLDYKMHFLPELRFNINLGIDQTDADNNYGTNVGSFAADKDSDYPGIGRYTTKNTKNTDKLLEAYLAYAKEVGDHKFDVLGGYSWQHFYHETDTYTYANETNELYNNTPFATEYYLLSFFGRANYTFKGKYMLTATVRNDASSRFHEDVRWGIFPSAALAWNMKQESWLKDVKALSTLKLRASWGETGQQDISQGNYPYIPIYELYTAPSAMYPIGGEYVNVLKPLGYNENVKWETTETWNVGVDFGFFNYRLKGSLDAYHRTTRDLLNVVPIPLGSNFTNAIISNIGNMRNQGVELSLTGTLIDKKDLTLDMGINATYQDTEITKLTATDSDDFGILVGGISSGTGSNIQIHRVGSTPSTFFTYQQAYDENGNPIQNALVDRDGDGKITEGDRYMTDKSPTPDVYFGLNMSLQYKNWSFGFNGHGSFGNWVYNDFAAGNSTTYAGYVGSGYLINMAQVATNTGFTGVNSTAQISSDLFLENASFFRMDDINLGYTFNEIGKTKLRLRTSLSVQNAFVITNYSGLDPENSGIDNNIWPRPRTYTLRLNFDF